MPMDRIKFAQLIGFISRISDTSLATGQLQVIDEIISDGIQAQPVPEPVKVPQDSLRELIEALYSDRKVDAIKAYRNLTGESLLNSKNFVESFNQPALYRIKNVLDTEETGDALVEVARNAHKAELQLAWLVKFFETESPTDYELRCYLIDRIIKP